jgi:Asp-tRNA(Asn)/Glu-tRNA(Gln) amidotransferase A subunit family amidase
VARLLEEFAPVQAESLDPAALGLINRPNQVSLADDLEFTMNVVCRSEQAPVACRAATHAATNFRRTPEPDLSHLTTSLPRTSQDPETAVQVKQLEREKERAIAAEDYRRAAQIKHAIAVHQETGRQLFVLAKEKKEAVAQEDFERAQGLKDEMDELRARVEAELTPAAPDTPRAPPRASVGHSEQPSSARTRPASGRALASATAMLPSVWPAISCLLTLLLPPNRPAFWHPFLLILAPLLLALDSTFLRYK